MSYWFVRNNNTGKVVAVTANENPVTAAVLKALGPTSDEPGAITTINAGSSWADALNNTNIPQLIPGLTKRSAVGILRRPPTNTPTTVQKAYITPLGGLAPLGALGVGVGAGVGTLGIGSLLTGGAEAGAGGAEAGAGGAVEGAGGAEAGAGGTEAGAGAAGAGAGAAGAEAAGGGAAGGTFSRFASAITSPLDFLMLIAWLFNPRLILRALEFLVGIALMLFGFHAAMQARGESMEGFQTGESALTRSGLGRVATELGRASRTGERPSRPRSAPHATRRKALRQRYQREENLQRRQNSTPRRGSAYTA